MSTTEKKATETVKENEKKVKIRILLERGNTDDVFVGVNGRTWLIKRGVEVEVPECVAEVLRHSEEARMKSYEFESSNSTN